MQEVNSGQFPFHARSTGCEFPLDQGSLLVLRPPRIHTPHGSRRLSATRPGTARARHWDVGRHLSMAKTPSARNPLIIQVVTPTFQSMIETLRWLAICIIAALRERRNLALENLALRQQLGLLKRRKGVPRLKRNDRLFWVVLSRIWAPWRQALHLVNGDRVVGRQQMGFRICGTRISQRKSWGVGRKRVRRSEL
jgi:hypothetical protein